MKSPYKYGQFDIPVYLLVFSLLLGGVAHGGGRLVSWGGAPTGEEFQGELKAVSAGYMHSLALTPDGRILPWGDNAMNQLDVPPALNQGIQSISAGGFHNVALNNQGTVIAWGYNADGQATVPPEAASGCIAAEAGMFHSLALHKSGEVRAWGYNEFGQTDVPVGLRGVIKISAGALHSVALLQGGSVTVWGDNSYKQLRIPDDADRNIVSVSAGYFHTLALTKFGRVIAWGDDSYDQCDVPEEAESGVVAISAGQTHSMALKADGTVIMWGGVQGVPQAGASTLDLQLSDISAGGFHSLGLVSATADKNNNRIPDWWELRRGLHNSKGAFSDADNDKFSDYDEYVYDTDPLNDASNFIVEIKRNENRSCEIIYGPLSSERDYTVEEIGVFTDSGNWKEAKGSTQVNESTAGVTVGRVTVESSPSAKNEVRFFRVTIAAP